MLWSPTPRSTSRELPPLVLVHEASPPASSHHHPQRSCRGVLVAFSAVLAIVAVVAVSLASQQSAKAQTFNDIETRDRLITAQEALLNAYRCRFDIDINIVPGGCTNGNPPIRSLLIPKATLRSLLIPKASRPLGQSNRRVTPLSRRAIATRAQYEPTPPSHAGA